jgi:hypothetical protein
VDIASSQWTRSFYQEVMSPLSAPNQGSEKSGGQEFKHPLPLIATFVLESRIEARRVPPQQLQGRQHCFLFLQYLHVKVTDSIDKFLQGASWRLNFQIDYGETIKTHLTTFKFNFILSDS